MQYCKSYTRLTVFASDCARQIKLEIQRRVPSALFTTTKQIIIRLLTASIRHTICLLTASADRNIEKKTHLDNISTDRKQAVISYISARRQLSAKQSACSKTACMLHQSDMLSLSIYLLHLLTGIERRKCIQMISLKTENKPFSSTSPPAVNCLQNSLHAAKQSACSITV